MIATEKDYSALNKPREPLLPSVGLSAPGQKWTRILPHGPEIGNSRRPRTIIVCDPDRAAAS
jgi:hypothetical protein